MKKKIFEKASLEIIISSNEMLTTDLDYTTSGGPGFDDPNDPLNP